MLQVRDGQVDAFATLVDRYQHRVTSLMVHFLGRTSEAEDLAQDVFLRLYRARGKYEPTARFSTWLFTVARRVALNAIRRRKRRPSTQLPTQGPDDLERAGRVLTGGTAAPTPEAQALERELAQQVRDAVDRLPESQRMAVVLNKFQNLSYEQIGEVMDLSIMAVKSLLARARGNLKRALEAAVRR